MGFHLKEERLRGAEMRAWIQEAWKEIGAQEKQELGRETTRNPTVRETRILCMVGPGVTNGEKDGSCSKKGCYSLPGLFTYWVAYPGWLFMIFIHLKRTHNLLQI